MRRSGSSCSSSTSPRSSSRHKTNTPMSSNSSSFSALPPHNPSNTTTNLHLALSINSPLLDQSPHDDGLYAINLNAATADRYRHHDDDDDDDNGGNGDGAATLFVKVYMEGHPIGRKLDILAHRCYQQLISTLDHMFNANILWGEEVDAENCEDFHVLTYEDEEGDWLMVGDVPWEMFLSTVKRLKITRACPC